MIRMRSKPRQLLKPVRLLTTIVGAGCHHIVLQLCKPWDEVPEFLFDVFALLGWTDQQDRGAIRLEHTS